MFTLSFMKVLISYKVLHLCFLSQIPKYKKLAKSSFSFYRHTCDLSFFYPFL